MFRNSDHALKWAFRVSGSGAESENKKRAQAALIIGMAGRLLDANEMAWVMAKYAKALLGGERERQVADQLVKVVIASAGTGAHSRRGYEKLVRIYFGQSITMLSVRTDMRCRDAQVQEIRKAVFDNLDSISNRAFFKMNDEMRRAGLILEEVAA